MSFRIFIQQLLSLSLSLSFINCYWVAGPATSSTADAIKTLRSRRPMSRTEVSDCLIFFGCLVVKLLDNTKGWPHATLFKPIIIKLSVFQIEDSCPHPSLSLSPHMRMLACAHRKSSGQRIKFKPCKITMTACQAIVYEIRFTFFVLSFFSLSIWESGFWNWLDLP
jgi:hypothetical protein